MLKKIYCFGEVAVCDLKLICAKCGSIFEVKQLSLIDRCNVCGNNEYTNLKK